MTHTIPSDLPENLVSILDGAIECLNQNKPLSEEVSELYDWFEDEGIDHLISTEATMPFALNILGLFQSFSDEDIADESGIEVDDLTNELRIAYARKEIKAASNFERASYEMLSVYCPAIKGRADKIVFLGCTAEEQGQTGMGIDWWGLYKSQDDFLEAIRHSEALVIVDEGESISDEKILKLLNDV